METLQIADLIELADTALAETQEQRQIELIGAYSEAFDRWSAIVGWTKDHQVAEAGDTVELTVLAERHALVVKRAEMLKGMAQDSLTRLQKKAKVILAYAGSGPKSVSMRPKQKM